MKLARWYSETSAEIVSGFIIDDLAVPFPAGVTTSGLLQAGLTATREVYEQVAETARDTGVPLEEVRLTVPLEVNCVRDFVSFEEHVEGVSGSVDGKNEVVPQWYEAPTFYFTNPHTVQATGATIAIPQTNRLDFELEVAVILGGEPASNLSAQEARKHIFGYAIFNDWSARDLQAREMKVKLGPCKGKDFASTLGPWIVTADEFEHFEDEEGFLAIRAEAYINGERIGHDLLSNMGWPFAELIAYASRNSRIVAGDVLGSGTIGNGGCLGELWGLGHNIAPLQPGDEVRLWVEGIGEIINTVGEAVVAPPIPPARKRSRKRER